MTSTRKRVGVSFIVGEEYHSLSFDTKPFLKSRILSLSFTPEILYCICSFRNAEDDKRYGNYFRITERKSTGRNLHYDEEGGILGFLWFPFLYTLD